MPVRDLGGSRLVVRLPDEKKLSDKQKKYLEPRLNKLNSDGEIWVLFGSSGGADVGEDYQELLELGFKGEDDGDPDMYSVPFASGVEIPWAHMVNAKYTDDNFPWMSLLWMMKNSTNWTFEDRPFRIVTEEEYVAQMAWLNEKEKPNNVLAFPKVTKKVGINTPIQRQKPAGNTPEIQPEGFLRISVLMSYVKYDPSGALPSDCAPSDSPFSGHFCQLLSPVGSSISKGHQPDFKYEVEKTAFKLKNLSVLFAFSDLVSSHQPASKENDERDFLVLAQSNLNMGAIIEFSLSRKVFQSIYDDCLANKRMQIFDLRFHNDLQRGDGFTIECSETESSDGNTNQRLRLKSDYDKGGALYVAEVIDRSSMSVSEYIKKTHFDPIFLYSANGYVDTFNTSFIEYLERNRAWLKDGIATHPLKSVPENKNIPNE